MDPIEEAEALVEEFIHGRELTPEEVEESRDAMLAAWEGTRAALEAHGYTYAEGPTWLRGMIDGYFETPRGAVIGVCIEWKQP
jgi:hypothetical protein